MLGFKRLLPLSNRVLIQRVEAATQTKGGILLPEASKDALNYGKVIAVGPGTTDRDGKHRACYVKGGETVLLPEYGGNKVKLADEVEYMLYRDDDLLGILHDPIE